MGKHAVIDSAPQTQIQIATAIIREDGQHSMTAVITRNEAQSEYTLTWTMGDKVWAESHESASVAFARMAALKYCEESDWNAGFSTQPYRFHQQAFQLFNESTTWDDDFIGWRSVDQWVPINDYAGDQRWEGEIRTADATYWGEIGTNADGWWDWTVIARNDTEQWDAASGTADTEAEAKRAVETFQP